MKFSLFIHMERVSAEEDQKQSGISFVGMNFWIGTYQQLHSKHT